MAILSPPALDSTSASDRAPSVRGSAGSARKPWAVRSAVAAVAVVVLAGVALFVARAVSPGDPTPQGDVLAVAEFVSTPNFQQLPEPQKRLYMARLREGQDQVRQAFAAGDLTEQQYQAADFNIWLERQLDRMDDYYKLPKARRQALLDELVEKKVAKKKAGPAADAGGPQVKFDHEDSEMMEARKDQWPADQKEKWKQFRNVLDQRERAKGV